MRAAHETRPLSQPQLAALGHVDALAARARSAARYALADILRRAEVIDGALDAALTAIRAHARVVVNFHPDRFGVKGRTVAEGLLHEGCYRSQFETGLSNGSLTAYAGGERDLWEDRLFGGAYQAAGVPAGERPKYGALELIRHPDGAAPRFGSCHLVLRAEVSERCSFTFGGSQDPLALAQSGTLTALECVMAALLAEVERGQGSLGIGDVTVAALLTRLPLELASPRRDPATATPGRALDSFIEAQVHGAIDLQADAEQLVADPSFRGTPVEEQLRGISARYGIPLLWHAGFTLAVDKVPGDFRGPAMPILARRIAGDGDLTIAAIGRAAASLRWRPDDWRDWGAHDETLQQLKQLWHVLVQYGSPAHSTACMT
jgi:hypothetical protein